jgi:hypothetical protein
MVRAVAALVVAAAVAGVWPADAASASPAHAAGAQSGWRWPVGGELSTAYDYGGDPYAAGQHRGIDVEAPVGAPVVAAAAGVVRFAGVVGSSGLTVSIRTADGRFDTSYLHLSQVAVRAGESVATGAAIGAVGTSGRRSAVAAHLHFGVRVAGTRSAYRDPLTLLPKRGPARDRPPGLPVPRAVPVHVAPEPRPVAPRLAPEPRPVAPRLAPAPARVPVRARVPSLRSAAKPAAPGARPPVGWAVACLALLIAAALVGQTSRSSIGARALLRHDPDLLRQR